MDDLISRSDAIGAVKEERFPIDSDYAEGFMAALDKVEWILKEWLPSAQPTEASCWGCNCQKMERLKDQKTFSEMVHLHDAETHEERTETHGVCLDTISRKAAIDALDKIFPADPMRNDYTQGITCGAALATEYIKQLSSAQQRWIPCSDCERRCDKWEHSKTSRE